MDTDNTQSTPPQAVNDKIAQVITFPYFKFSPVEPTLEASSEEEAIKIRTEQNNQISLHYIKQLQRMLEKHGFNVKDPEFGADMTIISLLLQASLNRNLGIPDLFQSDLDDLYISNFGDDIELMLSDDDE